MSADTTIWFIFLTEAKLAVWLHLIKIFFLNFIILFNQMFSFTIIYAY